jgi:hypothetical protein
MPIEYSPDFHTLVSLKTHFNSALFSVPPHYRFAVVYAFLISAMHAICVTDFILVDLITLMFDDEYKL